jgi:hypothetical protein
MSKAARIDGIFIYLFIYHQQSETPTGITIARKGLWVRFFYTSFLRLSGFTGFLGLQEFFTSFSPF